MSRTASEEYTARRAARQAARDALGRDDVRVSYARLATFVVAVALAIVAWRSAVSFWWLLPCAAVFAWLLQYHDRILRARERAIRGMAFYERGLARIEDRWLGTGEPGDRFRDDSHVYANDLDLFGRGSLFELLSLARTRSGEATLADWLTTPADVPEILARQQAVEELAPTLDLRERIVLAGTNMRAAVHTDRLVAWAQSPVAPDATLQIVTWVLTAVTLVAIALMALASTWWPVGAVVLVQALLFARLRGRMSAIVSADDSEDASDLVGDALTHRVLDLDVVADVLKVLEREPFRCAWLASLSGLLTADGLPASRIIGRLHRVSGIRDSTANLTLVPVAVFLMGKFELALGLVALLQLLAPHLALAVARWRTRFGRDVPVWIATAARFEAISSLSAYRYEHPDDPFPVMIPALDQANGPALFDGRQLGHPLIPSAGMVRNDVRLTAETQLLVVSGSNMSGKSTLLRTVGINAVLALAGAPVRAEALRLSPLAVGATLRIQDSLQEGRSRFYAEITRIREMADIASGPVPLLFLLDELLHGTNSHDRLVGGTGVLRSLLNRGAIGLITTHDLALTAVADELAPRAANVHFDDWFEGDTIRFDYRVKRGPVTHSNAIALMRAVGLDVPSAAADRV